MTRTEASTSGCWLPLQPSQPRPALLGLEAIAIGLLAAQTRLEEMAWRGALG
jgi:hypothetical protein